MTYYLDLAQMHDCGNMDALIFSPHTVKQSWPTEWTERTQRDIRGPFLPLLDGPLPAMPITDALDQRSSVRGAISDNLSFESLSVLLRSSLIDRRGKRPYPSAGARNACDVFCSVRSVPGVRNGDYLVDSSSGGLVKLCSTSLHDLGVRERIFGQALESSDPWAIVVVSAVFERASRKYRDRAYRYALIEAGAIMQSMLLMATSMSINAVPIGGFADALLERSLGISDPDERSLVSVFLS